MTSPNAEMTCPLCSALISTDETRCGECGSFFEPTESDETASPSDDGDFELAGESSQSSGFSGVFRMADDLEQEPEVFQKQNAPMKPGTQPTTSNANAANRESSGLSGMLELAENATPEEISNQHHAAQNPPPGYAPAQTAGSHPPRIRSQPPPPNSAQSAPSNGRAQTNPNGQSSAGMATLEFDDETPLPENRKSSAPSQSDVIRLTCKKCGRKLRVRTDRAGQRIKCPKCESKISVPRQREAHSEAASPPRHQLGESEPEIRFADLAKELEAAGAKRSSDAEEAKSKRPALSGRNYRRLTKLLDNQGALSTEDVSQRADALRELGQSGDPRAYDWLVADLDHSDLQIRQAAAVGLGDLSDSRGVPNLVAILDDHSMVMRKAAILGLGKIQDPRAIEPLLLFGLTDPQMKFLASEAVLEIGEAGVQTLIEFLESNQLGVVLEAIVLLGRMKATRARRALTAVIDARRPLLQCHAIEALGEIGDPKAVGPLTRLLENEDANIRVTAAAALSKMASDKNTVAPLVRALKDPDEDVVVQAARGLGESGDKRAAEPLSRFLKSPHEKVRVAAAQALGALGDQRAVPQLLKMLDEESEEIQIKVLATLRSIKAPHISGDVLKHIHHPKAAIRRRVVDVLGPIGDAEVAEQLEHLLRVDPADEVRMAAARSLGEIADPASVACLKDALHNDEFNVRCQVIGALGEIGDDECYQTLLALLDDQVAEVRFHAATALGEVGNKKAVPKLKELLKHKNPMVVRGAAKALEKLGVENVESQVKSAQRSRQFAAIQGLFATVQSWLPESARMQKLIYGGTLAGLVLVLGLGWLVIKMFQGPPDKVVIRGNVQTISFLPDSSTLAVGRTFGLLEIWKTDGSRPSETLTPPAGRIQATPNPGVFALVSGTAVQLWKKGDAEAPPRSGHSKPIIRYVVTPNLALMGTMSSDGVALVWDLKSGEPRAAVELPPKQVIGFALSADGSLFGGGNDTGGVTIWNAETGETVQQLNSGSGVTETCFSPDGTLLAVSTVKNPLGIYKVETGEPVANLPNSNGLSRLQFDPSGKYLLGQIGSKFHVWNAKTLADSPGEPIEIEVEAEEIDAVAVSPDSTKLAVGGKRDSAVWVYDLASGKLVSTLDAK